MHDHELSDISVIGDRALKSVSELIRRTFESHGVTVADGKDEQAARRIVGMVLHASMAANPRDWCLSCGTVSGDGNCHCTEPDDVADCMRKAVNYQQELSNEIRRLDLARREKKDGTV